MVSISSDPRRISQARTLARVDSFHAESRLPADERAELSDHRRSGYDRGHIAPNGDMATTESQYDSFSLANIAPQNGEHNRHLWRHIETQTRQLAIEYGEVYVVTGVAFLGKTSERIMDECLYPVIFLRRYIFQNYRLLVSIFPQMTVVKIIKSSA